MMDVEKLIEEVRKYPVLYDQTNGEYKNTEYKERMWKEIASAIKATGGVEICKKKWSSVRDHFRRIIQKRKTVSGQAPVSCRKYKFENHLDFLLPHITERETISNVPSPEDNPDDETESIPGVSQPQNNTEERETENEKYQIESVDDGLQYFQSFLVGPSTDVVKNSRFTKPAAVKRKIHNPNKIQESPSASSQLMEYILSEKRAEKERIEQAVKELPKHPVDAFLAGIAPSLKSLYPLLFHQAKSSIFLVVHEYELKQLMSNQNSFMGHGNSTNHPACSPASTSSQTISTPYPSPIEDETRPVYHQLHTYQPPERNISTQADTFADNFSSDNTIFF